MARFRNKSKNPGKNDESLHDWGMNLVEDGLARRRTVEAQWWENLSTYNGDLWAEFDITMGQLQTQPQPKDQVRIPVNLARPAVRTEYAKLLKNRPLVDCLAASDNREDLNSAQVGDKVLNTYIEKELQMARTRRKALQWLVICGCAGIFVDYDPSSLGDQEVLIGSDGQPIFDLSTIKAVQRYYRDRKKAPKTKPIPLGELRNRALSPWQFIYDFSADDYSYSQWCVVSEVLDVDYIFQRWGVEVDTADYDKSPDIWARREIERWDMTTRPDFKWSKGETQKLAEVYRMFVLPGHRYFPQGLEMVFTSTELLTHSKFPWEHGMLPVGWMGHVPMPSSQYSLSILQDIKPMVLELSKTESQMIQNRNLMANPPWIEYRENKIQGEIQNVPGARIRINYMPNVPEPHPVEMPDLAPYVKDLVPIMKEQVQEIGGQSEVAAGKIPAGARAGVTIAYLQEEDDTKIGPTVQEYEECIERTSWLQLKVIAQEYSIPRTVRIYKKNSEPEVFDFVGTMLLGVAGVQVQAGSALPRSKAAKQQFVLDLWDRKLEQDPRKVRQMLELNEGEPDEWEKDLEQANRENRRMMAGQTVEVKEWHNHPAHHYGHRDFMKSPEYEELDPRIQQIFEDHDQEHSNFELQQQQQLAALGAQGGSPPAPSEGGANGVTATPDAQFSPQEVPGGPNANGSGPPTNVQDLQPQ